MSLVDNKRGIVNSIGAYNSMLQDPELPENTDSLASINNNDDPVPFLLDVIKVIAGSGVIETLTGNLLTNFLDESEPVLKDSLINQGIQEDSNQELPNYFKPDGDGVNVPVEQIDLFDKLKTDPNSDMGSLLYGDNVNSFDSVAYNAITTGNEETYGNLSIKYNDDDTFTLKSATDDVNVGDWVSDFVNNGELINKDEFLTDVMDSIYGTVTSNSDKTEEQIFEELKILQTLENGINGSGLGLNDGDIEALLNRASEIKNGIINLDLGCGLIPTQLTVERLDNFINNFNGSSDANQIGNDLNDLVDDTIDDEEVLNENDDTIKDNFFQLLIQKIKLMIGKALIATPFGRIYQAILSAFKNNGNSDLSFDFSEDIENFKILIECILKKLIEELNKFIYELAIGLLLGLLTPIIKKITKERINNWIRVIKSLLV